MLPERLLPNRLMEVKEVIFEMVYGNSPMELVGVEIKNLQLVKFPTSGGILPLMLFKKRFRF